MKFKDQIGQNNSSRGVMTITLKFRGCLSIFSYIYIYILLLFSCDARIDEYSYVKANLKKKKKTTKTKLLNKW